MEWIFGFFGIFTWPIVIVGVLVYFISRRAARSVNTPKDPYTQIALSPEDAVSQWFLLLSIVFLGLTFQAINRDLDSPLAWQTMIFITSIVGIACSYYYKAISTLLVSILGVLIWWSAQAWVWIDMKDVLRTVNVSGVALLACLLYVIGYLHEKTSLYRRFFIVYAVPGIIVITGTLFFLSTKVGLSVFSDADGKNPFFASWQLTVCMSGIVVAFLVGLWQAYTRKLLFLGECSAILLLAILFGILSFLPVQQLFDVDRTFDIFGDTSLSPTGWFWAIVFNSMIFLELLGLIFSGYLRKEDWLVNVGTGFLFLLIFVKYFDWFFTFLDKSVFFIIAGLMLFVVGWAMERGRKLVLSNIHNQLKEKV